MNAPTETTKKNNFKNDAIELIRFTLIVLAIIIPLRVFVAQPFIVNGESMLPTLDHGDYLIIDQVSYKINDPERGEVIVFHFPTEYRRFLIKRIVGLPGETVTIDGSSVNITKPDGTKITLKEDYLNESFSHFGTWKIGPDEYFVMGDNRKKSSDSRSWGVLKKDLIVGKTFLRLFPVTNLSFTPAERKAQDIEQITLTN